MRGKHDKFASSASVARSSLSLLSQVWEVADEWNDWWMRECIRAVRAVDGECENNSPWYTVELSNTTF
jgi:hypothetical protein